jgi:hypothetical protein
MCTETQSVHKPSQKDTVMQAVNSSTPTSPTPGIALSKLPTSNKFEPSKNAELNAMAAKPSQLLVATCDCV